jgi:hypothetical protein
LCVAFSNIIERINRIQQENEMNVRNLQVKLGILATLVIGIILMTTFDSVAIADSGGHYDHEQMSPEKRHEHMKISLEKLAMRLEIKASQQTAWEEFAKSVGMLADRNVKKPVGDADAATIARYRAEMATEFASKLTKIADATSRLQASLTEDQRKILDQETHRFLNRNHDWRQKGHMHDCKGAHDGNMPNENMHGDKLHNDAW